MSGSGGRARRAVSQSDIAVAENVDLLFSEVHLTRTPHEVPAEPALVLQRLERPQVEPVETYMFTVTPASTAPTPYLFRRFECSQPFLASVR
jgi:hypothetical protein